MINKVVNQLIDDGCAYFRPVGAHLLSVSPVAYTVHSIEVPYDVTSNLKLMVKNFYDDNCDDFNDGAWMMLEVHDGQLILSVAYED